MISRLTALFAKRERSISQKEFQREKVGFILKIAAPIAFEVGVKVLGGTDNVDGVRRKERIRCKITFILLG